MVNAFESSDCPIPPVVRIPPGPMLPDDAVADVPDDIPDCTDPLTPMGPQPPCPVMEIGHASLSFVADLAHAGVSLTVTKRECCDFEFGFDLALPPQDCPVITVAGAAIKSYVVRGIETSASLGHALMSVTRGEGCEFDFDADIRLFEFSCAAITVPNPEVHVPFAGASMSEGIFRLVVTRRESGCAYDFDLEGNVPCPPITVDGGAEKRISVSYASSSIGDVVLRVRRGANCAFDFDMTMSLPCPPITTFGQSSSRTTAAILPFVSAGALGYSDFTVVRGNHCEHDMDVVMSVAPTQFAGLTSSSISARVGTTAGSGTGTLYRVIGSVLTVIATGLTFYNNMGAAVATGKHVQLVTIDGKLFVSAEDCS